MMSETVLDPSTLAYAERCLQNANALYASAEAVMGLKHYNITYHLSVLCLEEVGKASMVAAVALKVEADTEKEDKFISDKVEDHTFKLLWAFWNLDKASDRILPETFQTAMEMAKHVHKTRLATLYTSKDVASVDHDTALNMLNLAKAALALDNTLSLQYVKREDLDVLAWFIEAIKDPYNKARIFSQEYFQKFAELEKLPLWIEWIKQRFEDDAKQMKDLLHREISRGELQEDELLKPKWKVRFSLIASGVTKLSQPILNLWNEAHPEVKFTLDSSNKNRLIVDLTLPKLLHINQVHDAILHQMVNITLTLSIGTMGYYWRYNLLQHVERFEYFSDLENDTRSPYGLRNPYIDVWDKKEKKRTLTKQNIEHMFWVYIMLPKYQEPVSREMYGYYLQGLLDYAKHEAEEPRMINSGIAFLHCLEMAMLQYNDITERSQIPTVFFSRFGDLLDTDDEKLFHDIIEPYVTGDMQKCGKGMTADAATKMKIFCDIYLLQKFKVKIGDRTKEMQSMDDHAKEIDAGEE